MKPTNRPDDVSSLLEAILDERILVLDGAMGTMIQTHSLEEDDFRGEQFRDHPKSLKGCNDLLVLTRPDVIASIHRAYLEAGADIIETNTFVANRLTMANYGLEEHCYEINKAAAALAKGVATEVTRRNEAKPRFVAGSIGPTDKTASLSPKVSDPGYRGVTYDELVEAYTEQIEGLVDGGSDILFAETSFDTLNMKACLFPPIDAYFERLEGKRLPVMISATITDKSSGGPSRARRSRRSGTRCRTSTCSRSGSTARSARTTCGRTWRRSRAWPRAGSVAIPTRGCPTASATSTTLPNTWRA